MDNQENKFNEVDIGGKLTEDFVFEQLSSSFVVLENLISGSKNTKDNLERVFELLGNIRTILNEFREGLISIKNINNIAGGMESLDKTLKEWTNEEIKMISALNAVLTEQRELKDLVTKSNKKRIVEDIDSTKSSDGGSNIVVYIMFTIVICVQIATFVLDK
jgi:hypothetical protein